MMRLLGLLLLGGPLFGQLIIPNKASIFYPSQPLTTNSASGTLNDVAANDQAAMVFRSPVAGSLTTVSFRTSTVTTSQSLTLDLQTVDADTGRPTGSLIAEDATGVQASVAANTWYTVTLTTPPTVAVGDVIAIVIYFTDTAGNLVIFQGMGVSGDALADGATYALNKDEGTWGSKTGTSPANIITVGGVKYPLGALRGSSLGTSTSTFHSGSTPNEYGNRYIAADFTARAIGVFAWVGTISAGSLIRASVYDSVGALVASSSDYDGDQLDASNGIFFRFTTPLIIQRGAQYDVVLSPQNTNGIVMTYEAWASAEDLAAICDYGGNIVYVTRGTGGGVTTTRRTDISLVLDAMYAGSGGFVVMQ